MYQGMFWRHRLRNVISWKFTLQTQVSIYKILKIYYIMDGIVNSLIIIKTFPIQQAGTCNGGSETGQIDQFFINLVGYRRQ